MGHSNSVVFIAALAMQGQQVRGADLLTQVMENASDPFGEGLLQTITICGILAVLLYMVTMKKGEVVEQLTMADVVQQTPGQTSKMELGPEDKLY